MTWDYRIIEKEHEYIGGDDGEVHYSYNVHAVYYNSEDKIVAMSENPSPAGGCTLEEITNDLQMMTQGLAQPVLKESEIVYADWDDRSWQSLKREYIKNHEHTNNTQPQFIIRIVFIYDGLSVWGDLWLTKFSQEEITQTGCLTR